MSDIFWTLFTLVACGIFIAEIAKENIRYLEAKRHLNENV